MSSVVSENKNGGSNIWNKECEELLAEWSEKASCYRWLHGRCEKNYRNWYYGFSIPVIILSTLTGAANVGMDSFVPAESKSMASAIVGGVNIFAGIISTLQNFLKVAELMEGHRLAGVSWGKLQRNIAIELALDPERRVIQSDFLKLSRAEYDRLIEAGPIIDDGVIKQFNSKFKNYQVSIPSICNGLDKCKIFIVDKSEAYKEDDLTDGIKDLISEEEKLLNVKEKNKENKNENKNEINKEIKINIDEKLENDDKLKKDEMLEKDEELLPINTESLDKKTQTVTDKEDKGKEEEEDKENIELNEDDLTSEFLDEIKKT